MSVIFSQPRKTSSNLAESLSETCHAKSFFELLYAYIDVQTERERERESLFAKYT